MAAVAVTADNARIDAAEAITNFASIGAGPGVVLEQDVFYQGNAACSRKGSTSVDGLAYDGTIPVQTHDFTAARRSTWMAKTNVTTPQLLNDQTVPGLFYRIGSSSSDYYQYDVQLIPPGGGIADNYPPLTSFVIMAVDPAVATWRDGSSGTPSLSAIDWIGLATDQTGNSKTENVVIDAVDHGYGLNLVGGDGGDADGVFQDFVDEDEGTSGNRWGYVFTISGIIYAQGKLTIGKTAGQTTTATVFQDSARVVAFPHNLTAQGFNGFDIDLGNATTDVDFTNCTFIGAGENNELHYFDTELDVTGGGTDAIDMHETHEYQTGDAVLYSNEGGSETFGLTNNTVYYLEVTDNDTVQVHTTRLNATNAGTPINLTPSVAGLGERHSFRKQVDTRPELIVTGTDGAFDATGCAFNRFRNMTWTSEVTFTDCTLLEPFDIDINTGTLDSCTVDSAVLAPGEAAVQSTTLANISDCTFIAKSNIHLAGHAIRIKSTGTYAFDGNVFTDWGPEGSSGIGWQFHTQDDVDALNNEIDYTAHGMTTGDPIYYNDQPGNSDSIGLTDGDLYYARAVTADAFSIHLTREAAVQGSNPVGLMDGTSGETQSFYSAYAAIVNDSGGLVTINVTNGAAMSIRNIGASTTTVNVSVTLEINGVTEGTRCSMIGDGGAEDGVELLAAYADSTGTASGTFGGATPQNVIVRARNAGIINAAIRDDGGAFTDYTDEAREQVGADDVSIFTASAQVNDAFYFGGIDEFEEILANVSSAGSGYTAAWEYWNGAWVSLTVDSDGTNDFTTSGWNTVEFSAPSDWATTTINSQGPFYYVRLRITAIGTNAASAEYLTLNKTTKYLPFNSTGTIQSGSGLTVTAVWIEDVNNP